MEVDTKDWRKVSDYPKDTIFHEMVDKKRLFVFKHSFVNCKIDTSFSTIFGEHFYVHPNHRPIMKCFWAKHPIYGVRIFHQTFNKNDKKELRLLAEIVNMPIQKNTLKKDIIVYLKKYIIFEKISKKKKPVSPKKNIFDRISERSGKYEFFSSNTATGLVDTDSEDDE